MDADDRRKAAQDLTANLSVNPENLYRPRDGDIIIVGPPKSGTTWMQQILHQIRTKGDESFTDIYDVTWNINNPARHWDFNLNAEQRYNPRIFKHHEAYGIIESTDKQKHIVIIRDPYDAAYSFSKFINGFFGGDKEISDEDMSEMMEMMHHDNASGNFLIISTWWEHRNDPNVLFLFYDDLKRDLQLVIKKISEFIEIPLTDEELRRVCYLCSFEYMAKHKETFQGETVIEQMSLCTGLEKWTPKVGMVRPDGGTIGQGLNKIGPKLKATVDKLWADTVEKSVGQKSYRDLYEQHGLFH
jgi:hypothetical protein